VRRIAEALAELRAHARRADQRQMGSAVVKCAAPPRGVVRSTHRPDSTAKGCR
jgi:hypothetical protein